jgi:hypothetical protein
MQRKEEEHFIHNHHTFLEKYHKMPRQIFSGLLLLVEVVQVNWEKCMLDSLFCMLDLL